MDQAFPLRFCILQVIKNWMVKSLGTRPTVSTLGGFHVFTILFIHLPYKVSYRAMPISCCKTQYSYPPEAVPPQIILLTCEVGNKHLFVHCVCPLWIRVGADHSDRDVMIYPKVHDNVAGGEERACNLLFLQWWKQNLPCVLELAQSLKLQLMCEWKGEWR